MAPINLAQEVARIQRRQEEVRQYCDDRRRQSQNSSALSGSRDLPVWLLAITSMAVGAALFGAGMAFQKLLSM